MFLNCTALCHGVVWVLVILGTLGSQRSSPILEETLDIFSFMRVHCDTWESSRGHRQIGVLLGNVFVQILFPKHLFIPRTRTPYSHIRSGFWKLWLFPPSWLPSTFVRRCQVPVGFSLFSPVCSSLVSWIDNPRAVQLERFGIPQLVFLAVFFWF